VHDSGSGEIFADSGFVRDDVCRQGLKTLVIQDAQWQPDEMHVDVFLHLSAFASITRLTLFHVIFPSVQTFRRLVSALPGITTLHCDLVSFKAHDLRVDTYIRRPRNLAALDLRVWDLATMHDVSNFVIVTEMASTLKEITIRWPTKLVDLDESGIPALISLAGAALHTLYLYFNVDSLPVARSIPMMDTMNVFSTT